MDHFHFRGNQAYCEDLALKDIAKAVGTPCYVYSKATLVRHCQRLIAAFASYPTLPCFAVKANSNLSVLREIFASGFGADIVSLGELKRSLLAGADPSRIVFSGVGKTEDEIREALAIGIYAFNVESQAELVLLGRIAAEMSKQASISFRVNPNIDAKTNPKITTGLFSTKFGLMEQEVLQLAEKLSSFPALKLKGIGCHIGSQILSLQPLREAAERICNLALHLKSLGHPLAFIDLGGGLGIRYQDEQPPEVEAYAETLLSVVSKTGLRLLIEPGRVIVGNAGILLSSVVATKQSPEKAFLIVDAAMNDLIRPAMYDSYHEIEAVEVKGSAKKKYDVVGPICETSDIFGRDRELSEQSAGSLIFLRGAGAYGSAMASNYNSRPRPAEVLVDGEQWKLVRKRESYDDLWRHELV